MSTARRPSKEAMAYARSLLPARTPRKATARSALEIVLADSRRLEYLERLFKQARPWPLVCIETLPGETRVEACNKHHGDAAGRHTAPTLREAIDKAIAGRK
jgi:riboflavin biosynthesis pyrimidine reductase